MRSLMIFASWLEATPFSVACQKYSVWALPLCQILHFVGLCLLIGLAGFFDLRLLGFMKRVPVSAAFKFMPLAIFGLLLNLVTGLYMIVVNPSDFIPNPAMWAKMSFLVVAGLNALIFQVTLSDKLRKLGPEQDMPGAFKVVGAVSLFAWFAVMYFGRMLPYLGNAF